MIDILEVSKRFGFHSDVLDKIASNRTLARLSNGVLEKVLRQGGEARKSQQSARKKAL